ncbi:MAG: non-canonical purine NTP pyrophosphatase [Candidatus Chisholmbacteria bacterium]|nr:non-canonical purine NTP pyrophosphatase [Candidatus Chisholmbacteria bacterium]
MQKLLVATRNSGKLQEIFAALGKIDFNLLSLQDARVPPGFDIAETGKTLRENVTLKAKGFSQKTGLLTLADDTGLFVKALHGRPGVLSRRYAPTPEDRNKKLIGELKKHTDKSAYFKAIIALYHPHTKLLKTFTGISRGLIIDQPQGTHGFGYDPIFFSTDLQKTFAQATLAEKLTSSARGLALAKVRIFLRQLVAEDD